MERREVCGRAMHPIKDKRARPHVAVPDIKNGGVKIPRKGSEQLLREVVSFGVEKHDDGVDLPVWLILGLLREAIKAAARTLHLGDPSLTRNRP